MEYEEAKRKEKYYVEKFLATVNFKHAGTCNCGGPLNHKYRYKNYIIYIRYKQGVFKIKEGYKTLKDLTPINELEKYFQTSAFQAAPTGREVQDSPGV